MTKLQLLTQVSEADIFSKYIPGFNPKSKKNYKSPFADKDDKPSLAVYLEGDTLKFKSHNTGHQGDVFQFVADLHKIDCKKNFSVVIDLISKEFSLNGFSKPQNDSKPAVKKNEEKPADPASSSNSLVSKKQNLKISFEKEQTEELLTYYKCFKIDGETLNHFNVNQVKYHEFISATGKLCKFDYRRSKELAICYTIDDKIKIYFPEIENKQQKHFGFKNQTTAQIFGLKQISDTHHDSLFIAAGEKDCLALNSNGFASIAFQSENTIPNQSQVQIINSLADSIFVVYDNDTPGIAAAEKLCKFNKWNSIKLPEGFKDVADFFSKKSQSDFSLLAKKNDVKPAQKNDKSNNEFFTIFHQTENYLDEHYELRNNTTKLELEISQSGANKFEQLNENDLFVEMNKKGVKVSMDKLIAILKSSFVPKFNPIEEYFRSLPPYNEKTERDYIALLAMHLVCDNFEELIEQFKKWLVRCVRCALDDGYFNKQAFILVQSKQNSGKSTFCRFLCPPALRDYISENITDDKDSRIALAKNFMINLDELSSLAKHEINSLKNLFSKDIINERLPYDRKNSIIHRVANFIGSTNMAEFLTDETGSVRWLCFEIKSIDWNYKKAIDINKVWAQAYELYKSDFECEMTREDIELNEVRNAKFQQLSTEAEIVPKFFAPGDENHADCTFMSSSEILMHISAFTTIRLNKIMIGKAMPLCGFKRSKHAQTDRYGYWVRKLSE